MTDTTAGSTHQGRGGGLRPVAKTQAVTALSIAWTPNTERIGERLVPGGGTARIGRATETFGLPPSHERRRPLDDPQMSRAHADVARTGASVQISDAGSTNGTYINGRAIGGAPVTLQDGDVISMGDTVLLYHKCLLVPPPDAEVTGMLGVSAAMRGLRSTIAQYARASAPVLITGETGVGKELVAQAMASLSRGRERFMAFNTTATSEHLVDATLFGAERGAYTGADRAREGLFKAADGGTLFLDEIGELNPDVQVKLLRVLQEGEVTPVGSVRPFKVDVRLVTATNRDLMECVRSGSFRKDLYPRLAKLTINVPALGQRREDIPLLADWLAERYAGHAIRFSVEAITRLMLHGWPMNVRELDGVVTQAVVDWGSKTGPIDLSPALIERMESHSSLLEGASNKAASSAASITREDVAQALSRHKGNMKRAAEDLGVDRAYLYRILKKHDLKADDFR